MVNRVVVGAHYGLGSWLIQRMTAVVMVLYTLILLVVFLFDMPSSYASWKALFAQGWMRAATLLFIASVLFHAWIGMRDVYMDYVKPIGLRLAFEVATIMLLGVYAAWAAQILWQA
jgi:succinate dehydrogenase / fumarate reductase membrane anchor subunit